MSAIRRDMDPAERPLAFDARRSRAPARRSPAPLSLILSLLILGAMGGGVYWLYRGGARAPSGPPAPVGVPIRDVRVAAPPQPAQTDPAAGLTVYTDNPNAQNAVPVWAPAPEQPMPRPGAPPATVSATVPAAAPGKEPVAAGMAGAQAPSPALYPVAPTPKPASIDDVLAASAKPATARPAQAKTPPVKTAAVRPADAGSAAKAGGYTVQIGAFSSEALADRSWASAAGLAPADMAGKGKHIAPLSRNGATLYRVAVTGFGTRAAAEALCARLTSAGRTCFVR